ncbi:mitochondrial ribonuclease P protein 1 homolog [Varroa jacobsoni]|nr:mitochondrial ribonuclease P protein 1 homolog [Varroa jacobsoni]
MLSVTQSFMEIVLREVHLFARQSRFLSASAALSQPAQKRTPDSHREKQQPQKLHSDIEQIETKYRLQPVTYAVDDFRSIINTEKDAKKVHIILLELESLRINGDLAPCYLNKKDMLILMDEASLSNRVKYLNYMYKAEKRKFRMKVEKEINRLKRDANPAKPILMDRGIYPIIRPQQEALFFNSRLATAAQFGQKLVLDCSFEANMNRKQIASLGTLLRNTYSSNRISREPFDIILSDIQRGDVLDKVLDMCLPNLNSHSCLITKSYATYLEMFPKERILYLTPNSNNVIMKWDPEAVIVIGALVDNASGRPLTFAKALRQGVRHGKLPVGHYLPMFRINTSVSLTFHAVVDILLELKQSNDWKQAFTKIPKRIITSVEKVRASQHPISHRPGWSLKE